MTTSSGTAAPTWLPLRLERRDDHAHGLASFTFSGWDVPFVPGQYCTIARTGAAEGEKPRQYSIASAPGAPLQLYITEVVEGTLTPWLFALRSGDTVLAQAVARGKFTLEKVPSAATLWLVGTGTGLAPFLSMARAGASLSRFGRTVLVHTARTHAELAHGAELAALQAASDGKLVVLQTLTREVVAGTLAGRVTQLLDDGSLERAAGVTLAADDSQVMLCGNPQMLEDMRSRLEGRGLALQRPNRPGQIHWEKFW